MRWLAPGLALLLLVGLPGCMDSEPFPETVCLDPAPAPTHGVLAVKTGVWVGSIDHLQATIGHCVELRLIKGDGTLGKTVSSGRIDKEGHAAVPLPKAGHFLLTLFVRTARDPECAYQRSEAIDVPGPSEVVLKDAPQQCIRWDD